jgi:hypothetical protein
MSPMTPRDCALVLSFSFVSACGLAATPPCNMNPTYPAPAVYAQVNPDQSWAQYPAIEKVPELDLDGGISAEMWVAADGSVLVRTVETGEDFWIYSEYCFATRNRLAYLRLETRTAWGWGYRTEGPVLDRRLHKSSETFFSTSSSHTISRPRQAGEISGALQPKFYWALTDLPFYQLLAKHP